MFSPTGTPLDTWGVSGSGPQNLTRPYGVDLDPAGNVYVADSNNHIHKFTPSGGFLAAYGSPGDGAGQFRMLRRGLWPRPIAGRPRCRSVDLQDRDLQPGGGLDRPARRERPDIGFFNEPYGLAVDQQHLFVVDMVNQRVQRFSSGAPYGFQLTWGSRGWGEGNPGFNWARDATIGSNGGSKSLWVADTKNNRFTEFWPDGTATGRAFGSLGSGAGQFDWPFAVVAMGPDVIVADTRNIRVQRWNPAGPGLEWTTASGRRGVDQRPEDVAVSAAMCTSSTH